MSTRLRCWHSIFRPWFQFVLFSTSWLGNLMSDIDNQFSILVLLGNNFKRLLKPYMFLHPLNATTISRTGAFNAIPSLIWCSACYNISNIHTKISAFWLTESMSINPKHCKNLKIFECRKTKLVQKVEIKNDWPVPWKTVTKKENGGQVCWEQQHLNSKFKG